jgi:quinol monooxygenase YgiN
MIIRLFHAKVKPGRQSDFKKTLEMLSIPNIQSGNGMIAFYPGQPLGAHSNEFVLVTVWTEAAEEKYKTQTDWAKAIIPAEVMPMLEEWHVHGYKSFGILEQPMKPLLQNF